LLDCILGIYIGVYSLSVYTASMSRRTKSSQRAFFVLYSSFQFLCNTVFFMGIPLLGQRTWVTNRNGAGGPLEYFLQNYTRDNYVILGSIAQNMAILLADMVLVSDKS
jgi:hypothetical protein